MNLIKINEGLAEIYGALIGDGCLSQYPTKDRNNPKKVILFTGHLSHDFDYYVKIIRPIFIKEFNTKGYIYKREKYNCIRYVLSNNVAFEFFKKSGFPIGKKLKLGIPRSILLENKKSISCVRGIFDTDGSIYQRYSKKYKNHAKHYNYHVIQFKMNSKEVIKQIKLILENNNIKTNKIIKDKKCYVLRITNQKEIDKFMQLIKPNNRYHRERYLNNS